MASRMGPTSLTPILYINSRLLEVSFHLLNHLNQSINHIPAACTAPTDCHAGTVLWAASARHEWICSARLFSLAHKHGESLKQDLNVIMVENVGWSCVSIPDVLSLLSISSQFPGPSSHFLKSRVMLVVLASHTMLKFPPGSHHLIHGVQTIKVTWSKTSWVAVWPRDEEAYAQSFLRLEPGNIRFYQVLEGEANLITVIAQLEMKSLQTKCILCFWCVLLVKKISPLKILHRTLQGAQRPHKWP